jgi:hypothetical protein
MIEEKFPSLDEARNLLSEFFAANSGAQISPFKDGEKDLLITMPWEDSSLSFLIEEDFVKTAEILNNTILPPRLSAIYHKESKELEIIWTAFKLGSSQDDVKNRKFNFEFKQKNYECSFGAASDRLNFIAKITLPVGVSETNYRNLYSFSSLMKKGPSAAGNFDHPRSFIVKNIEWNESEVIDFIFHLNFYLKYFDSLSPIVMIHSKNSDEIVASKTRYIFDKFPEHITSSVIDENLLSFWHYASDGDPMLRFLLYYRILEYAAFHFVTAEVKEKIKKILISPQMRSDVAKSIEDIASAVGSSKIQESQKITALSRNCIDPKVLWKDIHANKGFFSKPTEFEGGFVVKPAISKTQTEATFDSAAVEQLMARFRDIRNALSHGKDQEHGGVIRPTPNNVKLFLPWVHLIGTAAAEVVLYKNAT